MKKPSRSFLVLSLIVVALVTSRCDCGQANTSAGRCEGFVGALRIAADIDNDRSYYGVNYVDGLDNYYLSFGNEEVHINAAVSRADVLSGGVVLNLPSEVTGGGGDGGMGAADAGPGGPGDAGTTGVGSSEIKSWELSVRYLPFQERPKIRSGTLERSIDLVEQRLVGVLRLFFEDGTSLLCDFALRHETFSDVGGDPEEPSAGCGGGGGGDSDFD